ncbi:MAG: insulinase family protein, partial [Bacteroidetes bacterium]|nr:insulinase family protein [Bacteroidota bacterium]
VGENISKNLYPYGHPYSWLTIGYTEDLDRVDVNDLKRFFMRWYGPNNATLTIGGAVNTVDVLKLVEKYFGSIKPCPAVNNAPKAVAKLSSNRYVSMEDNIRFPQLNKVYPSVPQYHPDEPALDVLAYILGNGKGSLLYKNFEKAGKAINTSASNGTYELAGEFQFTIRAYPGTSLKSMDSLLTATLTQFEQSGVSADDLQRAKAFFKNNIFSGLESVSNKVSRLASYQTFTGNANYINNELDAYNNVSIDDIKRVYAQYIKNRPSLTLSVMPKGQTDLKAAEDNYKVDQTGYKKPKDEYAGLKYTKAVDVFDRSQKPVMQLLAAERPINMWNGELKNGVKVNGIENFETPMIELQIVMKGGHLLDAYNMNKNGLAELTARLMNESTKKLSAEEMSNELGKIGSSISVSNGSEATTISVSCNKTYYPQTIALLMQRIMEPKFDSVEFERVKKQMIEGVSNQANQPTVIANKVYSRLLFGDQNIKGLPENGSIESVKSITLSDIKAFYKSYYNPYQAYVNVVGSINQNEAISALSFMNSWNKNAYDLPAVASSEKPKTKIYLVDKEKAAQSEIRVGCRTLNYEVLGDHFKCRFFNYPLSGNFNSRINQNLREKNGWTYGIRGDFGGSSLAGVYTISAGVRSNATDSSIKELMGELQNYMLAGMNNDELSFTKNAMIQSEALKYEKLGQKLAFLQMAMQYDLDPMYSQNRFRSIMTINKSDMQRIAIANVSLNNLYIVIVGDKKTIKPGLENLGYEIVELDKDGNKIN